MTDKKELAEQIAELIASELGGYKTIYMGNSYEVVRSQFVFKSTVLKIAADIAAIIEAMGTKPESIGINPKYRKLASKLLEMAAIEFGTHGCNDLDERFFDDWTNEERVQLAKDYEQWNSEGEYYNPKFLTIPDYALMDFFAYLLNNEQNPEVSDTRNDAQRTEP